MSSAQPEIGTGTRQASLMQRFMRSVRRITSTLACFYIGVLALLYFGQGFLIYHARTAPEATLLADSRYERLEPWRDHAGEIVGWHRPNPRARNRVLVFHGNAGYALNRVAFVNALQAIDLGNTWEVFLFEYPGYGSRPGVPGEQTITAAGRKAIEELLADDSRPLFLIGESLGSGPASALAAEFGDRIPGVALLIPYQSLSDAARHQYPWVPVRLLMHDRFDNSAALERYHGPVAFVLAGEDEVVTLAGGQRLHDGYRGPKSLRIFPGIGHNELDYSVDAPWWGEITQFLTQSAQRRDGK